VGAAMIDLLAAIPVLVFLAVVLALIDGGPVQ
jgi:hypothetical protein